MKNNTIVSDNDVRSLERKHCVYIILFLYIYIYVCQKDSHSYYNTKLRIIELNV